MGQPNIFAGAQFDRAAALRRDEAWIAERLVDPASRFAPVWQLKNLFTVDGEPRVRWLTAEEAAPLLGAGTPVFLGMADGAAHFAVEMGHEDPADVAAALGGEFQELRRHGSVLPPRDAGMLAFARGMMHWHARHRFCGVCGEPTEQRDAGHVRACTAEACGAIHFPRTDPAVIMLVTHEDRALLGRQAVWDAGRYSTLAGFVEPGESLEDAVAREVWEEAGVRLGEIRYHSSQPWPFPSSLMVGFTAEALDDTVTIDHDELEDARWFTRDEIRRDLADGRLLLPSPLSISYRLVTGWLE
ncbi:MAG TPA: NAD(+) diphosphatase, partial [Longimicrobiaceae bacterium]